MWWSWRTLRCWSVKSGHGSSVVWQVKALLDIGTLHWSAGLSSRRLHFPSSFLPLRLARRWKVAQVLESQMEFLVSWPSHACDENGPVSALPSKTQCAMLTITTIPAEGHATTCLTSIPQNCQSKEGVRNCHRQEKSKDKGPQAWGRTLQQKKGQEGRSE